MRVYAQQLTSDTLAAQLKVRAAAHTVRGSRSIASIQAFRIACNTRRRHDIGIFHTRTLCHTLHFARHVAAKRGTHCTVNVARTSAPSRGQALCIACSAHTTNSGVFAYRAHGHTLHTVHCMTTRRALAVRGAEAAHALAVTRHARSVGRCVGVGRAAAHAFVVGAEVAAAVALACGCNHDRG